MRNIANLGKIFLTGGTGTFGRAILARAIREDWPCTFTIYSRDEMKQEQLRSQYLRCPKFKFVLGDVRDLDWLTNSMRDHDTAIHAAAYKRIESAERNVAETIKTNITGSLNVALAAVASNVHHAVCISSDKACMPINLYGSTKMTMERIFQRANNWGNTTFHLVRYGNVIASRGSVIPLFRRQAKSGGPLTITHKEMTRFWHTIDQGIDLVMRSLWQPGGTILIPKAKAMSVMELARAVAPGTKIVEVGMRPGEKLHETLICELEAVHTEDKGNYFLIWPYGTPAMSHNLPSDFEYTSDKAPKITIDEMRSLLEREK